jgi:archaellum component FlaF (FlaF/FlaG flagellin family)
MKLFTVEYVWFYVKIFFSSRFVCVMLVIFSYRRWHKEVTDVEQQRAQRVRELEETEMQLATKKDVSSLQFLKRG